MSYNSKWNCGQQKRDRQWGNSYNNNSRKKRRQFVIQTLPEAEGSGQSRMPRTSNNFEPSYGLSTSRLSNNSKSSRWRRAAETQDQDDFSLRVTVIKMRSLLMLLYKNCNRQ